MFKSVNKKLQHKKAVKVHHQNLMRNIYITSV
jgi:hypothetical protein